ncbi:major facilitator superfamily domain-containing protein 8-like isoform X2 [Maniola hyperantus]|uniref:major facilitator superfamily domain-containing protein 8-like isoform X2 n=1 Tax=Aphantopus hyperantus TaxID=2795564 RepID=UPI003747C65F
MEWLRALAGRREADGGAGDGGALETAQERRERWRSVYVIYFTMFQMSLGFSIVLTGVWPYLDKESSAAASVAARPQQKESRPSPRGRHGRRSRRHERCHIYLSTYV